MKILMRFIRPYRGLAAAALLFVFLDVAGALVIPTITADLINVGVGTGNMDYIIEKGILMMAVTVWRGLWPAWQPSVSQTVRAAWEGYEKCPV